MALWQSDGTIDKFTGKYEFLSNFHQSTVMMDGYVYPTVEHAYQAAKVLSVRERRRIRECATPGQAKRLGRKVKLRKDWEDVKIHIMQSLVDDKFRRHMSLAIYLLKTDNAVLVEGNTWGDQFWGKFKGKGENHLGKILMRTRYNLSISPNAQVRR